MSRYLLSRGNVCSITLVLTYLGLAFRASSVSQAVVVGARLAAHPASPWGDTEGVCSMGPAPAQDLGLTKENHMFLQFQGASFPPKGSSPPRHPPASLYLRKHQQKGDLARCLQTPEQVTVPRTQLLGFPPVVQSEKA